MFTLQNNSCAKLGCSGSIPTNATLIPGDDQGLTAPTTRRVVSSNTSAKCEYMCNAGYVLQNGACVRSENKRKITVRLSNPDGLFGVRFGWFYVDILSSTGNLLKSFAPGLDGEESWNDIPANVLKNAQYEYVLVNHGLSNQESCVFTIMNDSHTLHNEAGVAQHNVGGGLLPNNENIILHGLVTCH